MNLSTDDRESNGVSGSNIPPAEEKSSATTPQLASEAQPKISTAKPPEKWPKKPKKSTSLWWQEYCTQRRPDPCPRCSAGNSAEAEELETETLNVEHRMYGMVRDRHCLVCDWKWTLSVAEEPDN
jgi:hypothetical protein